MKRSARRSITIVEQEADIVRLIGRGPKGEIEVITDIRQEGDTLILRGTHIEGLGAGTLGIGELREFARELGRQHGVRRVKIFGGTRTTGANPGRTPRPIVIEVN